jgi:hypothetical protein
VSSRNGGRPATPWARGPSHPDWWDAVLGSYKRYAERERMPTLPAATAEVTVDASPEEAFRIFTDEIGLWWRRNTPYWNDAERGLSVRIEPAMNEERGPTVARLVDGECMRVVHRCSPFRSSSMRRRGS